MCTAVTQEVYFGFYIEESWKPNCETACSEVYTFNPDILLYVDEACSVQILERHETISCLALPEEFPETYVCREIRVHVKLVLLLASL